MIDAITFHSERLLEGFKRLGYTLRTGPYKLNLVGIRAALPATNKFDDAVGALFQDHGLTWNVNLFNATTDPGTYYLENPMNVKGTAILVPGQYREVYTPGIHQGSEAYRCLVQVGAVKVWRDKNKNEAYDHDPSISDTGMFAIEIHTTRKERAEGGEVGKFSAGCQVIEDADVDFVDFMRLVDYHISLGNGGLFDYTLFGEKEIP